MKKQRLRPILDKDIYATAVEKLIKYHLYQQIFKPLFDVLNVKPKDAPRKVRNSTPGSLERAIEAGHQAFQAQPIEARDMAAPSTPVMGKAFLS